MFDMIIKIKGNRAELRGPVAKLNRDLLKGLLYVVGWGYGVRVFVDINGAVWRIMPKQHTLSYYINEGEEQLSPMFSDNMDLSIDILCEIMLDYHK